MKTIKTDFVIVGGGATGLTAAVEATENGASVIHHKKRRTPEVLSADHDIIPGLYAVGDDANSIYGDSYAFILPGNTMGFALNSGRIAAENALKYIVSLK